jgi:hypothetical protein
MGPFLLVSVLLFAPLLLTSIAHMLAASHMCICGKSCDSSRSLSQHMRYCQRVLQQQPATPLQPQEILIEDAHYIDIAHDGNEDAYYGFLHRFIVAY